MQTSQSEPVINFLYTIRMVHYNIQSNYLFGENLNISQSLISFFVYICYFLHFYLGRLWKLRYGGNRKLNGKRLSLPFWSHHLPLSYYEKCSAIPFALKCRLGKKLIPVKYISDDVIVFQAEICVKYKYYLLYVYHG